MIQYTVTIRNTTRSPVIYIYLIQKLYSDELPRAPWTGMEILSIITRLH